MIDFISAKCYFSGLAMSKFEIWNEIKMLNFLFLLQNYSVSYDNLILFVLSKASAVLILNNS